MNPEKFFVTTPIYYVNDNPHIGHLYTTLAADFLARHHRLDGDDVFFLTGTDEHGQKAWTAAKEKGQKVKEHVDYHSAVFKDLWKSMNISNDDFIRTTEARHTKVVQRNLQKLYDAGEIYADSYQGWYCVPDERFWTEKDLAEGNCPDCGRKVEKIEEKNYFFKMGKHQEWLVDYIKKNENFIAPKTRRNEVIGFLDQTLEDLCISRPKSRMEWGIELPFDKDFVAYVWFDALQNYISANSTAWPADIHLIGKDILTTHSVYWITMLHALGLPLPKRIFAHGWWTIEGKKMSKSLGNAIEPLKVASAVGLDPLRYFLMREVPFGNDGDFSIDSLISRINVDLANNFGNLISRVLKMILKYREGEIPAPHNGKAVSLLKKNTEDKIENYKCHVKNTAINKSLENAMMLCDTVNQFIVEQEPWTLAKDESKSDELDDVLYGSLEAIRIIGRMLLPVMPETMEKLFTQISVSLNNNGWKWGILEPGKIIIEHSGLFPRIDDKQKEKIREMILPKKKTNEETDESGLITIDDFKKIDLRTAQILEAERVKKSEKLIKLQIDVGGEKRQVVAGIGKDYEPKDLLGLKVLVVANLKSAKLMGVESNGMLLAANDGGRLSLITVSKNSAGGLKVS